MADFPSQSMRARPKRIKKREEAGAFDLEAFLAKVGITRTIVRCQKDYVLKSAGDPADSIFYIQKGGVKLTVTSKQGKEAVIGILGPREFFGEGCIVGQPLRLTKATAIAPSSILRIERDAMLRAIREEPQLSALFISHLLSRVIRMQEDLAGHLLNSSEQRLARTLLLLANYGKGVKPQRITPEINQQVLAQMIGTTRSRVSFFMNKFKKLGFIKYNGGLLVRRSLESVLLHD